MPHNTKTFRAIYEHVFGKPYSYLFLDGHQKTDNLLRIRPDIFGDGQTIFIPK
jgi:hypothetical protein